MSALLRRVSTKNYRSLADVSVELGSVNVLFGPNGAGKSTFLDTIWFVRDCAVRGVDDASSDRSHGIGILWDGAAEGDRLEVTIETDSAGYALSLGLSSGRIEPYPGERLRSSSKGVDLIERSTGSDKALFRRLDGGEGVLTPLREPEKLSLGRYLDFEPGAAEAAEMDRRLRYVHHHPSRSFDLRYIKQRGSEKSHETWLSWNGKNLWSVLQNLQGRRAADDRYDTILSFMRRAFPAFRDLVLDPVGPSSVYGSFLERGRRMPILASGMSDGHIQLLLLLTSLFAEGRNRASILLFDEPELSLHPWALAVLAEAVKAATSAWQKQALIATHSPVLMSQFGAEDCLAVELSEGRTRMQRLGEKEGIADLLEQYAVGSLFMAESVAPQSAVAESNGDE